MPHLEPFVREALPHLAELRSAARRFAGARRDLADDLVQETFVRALAAADRYQPGSNARAWLHAILGNAARTRFRRERRDMRLEARYAVEPSIPREVPPPRLRVVSAVGPASGSAVGQGTEPGPRAVELTELVAELPPSFRAVVELVDLQGLGYREAAERLGCPVGTVMSRLHRARRRLRDRLEGGAPRRR